MKIKLTKRDKYLLVFAACFIVTVLFINMAVLPFFASRENIRRGIAAKEKGLQEIMELSAVYQALQKESQVLKQRLDKRQQGFTLFSFLEKEAGTAGVKNFIKYMKPSVASVKGPFQESMVEIKLEGIGLEQLVEYLRRVEYEAEAVSVKRITIQTNKRDAAALDVTMQVMTYENAPSG